MDLCCGHCSFNSPSQLLLDWLLVKIQEFSATFQGDIYPLINVVVACHLLHLLGDQNQSDAGF